MLKLTKEEWIVLQNVLLDPTFQALIGAEEWALTEDAEETLWGIIHKAEKAQL
jgi:hypothetical protein